MRIITIGREFGSGGRELGKRLADELGIPCYDKQIIDEVAKLQGVSPEEVERISQMDISQVYTSTIGRTISTSVYINHKVIDVIAEQNNLLKSLVKNGDCVIVGRQSDVILAEYKPLNLFVYADTQSKLNRCMQREKGNESEKSILKQMKKIDKDRRKRRALLGADEWGKKENYHLCINTSGREIKALVAPLVEYVNGFFDKK